MNENHKIRLAKCMAQRSIASTRACEELIRTGRVSVNGSPVSEVLTFVSESDLISVDGLTYEHKPHKNTRIWMLYKPRGVLTSNADPQKRKLIFDIIPRVPNERLITIGRLDYNSEGLLLLTNNGMLARHMELPCNALKRVYLVRAYGTIPDSFFGELRGGIRIQGVRYQPIMCTKAAPPHVHRSSQNSHKNTWLRFELYEGKNREIRRIMEHFGCIVNRLIRIEYGPFRLHNMKTGDFREINKSIVNQYLNRISIK